MNDSSFDSEPSVLKQIMEIMQNGKSIHLMNVYQGVPIHHEATITMISQGYIVLSVHPQQAVCIAIEKRTYIQSESFDHTYKANLAAVDVPACEVMLVHLIPAEYDLDKRTALRVQPKEPLPVKLFIGNYELSGVLADLSPKGVGLFTFWAYIRSDLELHPKDEIFVEIRLPSSGERIKVHGTITNITREQDNAMYRIGIQTSMNERTGQQLFQYIEERKTEILEELDRKYETMCISEKL